MRWQLNLENKQNKGKTVEDLLREADEWERAGAKGFAGEDASQKWLVCDLLLLPCGSSFTLLLWAIFLDYSTFDFFRITCHKYVLTIFSHSALEARKVGKKFFFNGA